MNSRIQKRIHIQLQVEIFSFINLRTKKLFRNVSSISLKFRIYVCRNFQNSSSRISKLYEIESRLWIFHTFLHILCNFVLENFIITFLATFFRYFSAFTQHISLIVSTFSSNREDLQLRSIKNSQQFRSMDSWLEA